MRQLVGAVVGVAAVDLHGYLVLALVTGGLSYDGWVMLPKRIRLFRVPLFSIAVFSVVSAGLACRAAPDEATVQRNLELAGSWMQIMEEESGPRPTTVRNFFLDSDGALRVGSIEIGVRSRVGLDASAVEYDGVNIRWDEGGSFFRGTVAEGKDSIGLQYGSGEMPTTYRFERYPEGDAVWRDLRTGVDAEPKYAEPDATEDGWTCTDLETAGLDREKVNRLIRRIASGKYDDLHSFLLVKDGSLVVEEYFGARGRVRGPSLRKVFRDTIHHLGSTTKAVTSLLVGIAIDRGLIESADVPIFGFFPEYEKLRSPEKDRILLRHLLTMTAGLEWEQFRYSLSDPKNDAAQMWRVEDVLDYTLAKPVVAEPGEKFKYSNGISTLLGAIIKNATGKKADKFGEELVFDPLGITNYEWTRYPDGSIETDGGLALRPRDLAKIGQVFLDDGVWEGERIVSHKWVSESTRTHFKFRKSGGGYGFNWQQMAVEFREETVDYFFMPGYGGNLLAVIPSFDIVIVFTGANYDWNVRSVYNEMLEDHLLPTLQ